MLLLLSGVIAVAPIAEQRPTSERVGWQDEFSHTIADRVVQVAALTRHSAVFPLVASYNRFDRLPQLQRVQSTVAMVQDPHVLAHLADHPAMQRLYEKPSVRAAMESLANDPQLSELAAAGKTVNPQTAYALLNNPTTAKLLEQPELIRDIPAALGEIQTEPVRP